MKYRITVVRDYQPKYTRGVLTTSLGTTLYTIELPWEDNKQNISCIPAGTYSAFIRDSPTNGRVIELKDVPGRTYIQFHVGNYVRDVVGCFAVGIEAGVDMVYSSKQAMRKLLAEAEKYENIIVIVK